MRPRGGAETNSEEVIVAVDIGTTKVCAVAGRLNEYGKIEVLGMGKVRSEGVLRGVISNIEKTVKAIKDAIMAVERQLGTRWTRRRCWFDRSA